MMQAKTMAQLARDNIAKLNKVATANRWRQALVAEPFQAALAAQLAAADFTATTLLQNFVTISQSPHSAADWLNAIYQFALGLTYPHNAQLPDYDDLADNAYTFLELYRLVCQMEKTTAKNSFVYDYPFALLSEREVAELEDPTEYRIVQDAFRYDYIYELMKLSSELFPYTTLQHITGVHYLALFIARQVKAAGIAVDLGVVSGAAALHDIGKYGCRPEESHKVAYYHYYYSEAGFYRKGIQYIRNIAVNHSTWDLELESLSIESLILIYADFRVKEQRDAKPYKMKFYSLEESFDVILAKLDDVDQAKAQRYRKVYDKLVDFQTFLRAQGVATSFDEVVEGKAADVAAALLHGAAIVERYKHLSIAHSLALMAELRNQTALLNYLDDIKNTADILPVRRKMIVLAQFSRYLTPEQKQIVLDFLFDMLVLHEEDLRRQIAEIMGQIIVSFDDPYSKYLPPSVDDNIYKLSKSSVLRRFVERFLNPAHSRSRQKQHWIGTALSDLFRIVIEEAKRPSDTINLMLEQFSQLRGDGRIYLLAALLHLPTAQLGAASTETLSVELAKSLDAADAREVVYAALCVRHLLPTRQSKIIDLATRFVARPTECFYLNYLKQTLLDELAKIDCPHQLAPATLPDVQLDALYLENLKSQTAQVVKQLNIDFLCDYMAQGTASERFYFAVHLSNLIKNSEHYDIRLLAGRALLQLADRLSNEQLNEIVIELLRGLEIENYQFAKHIPPILGRLIALLTAVECREVIEDLEFKITTGSDSLKLLVVETAAQTLIAALTGAQPNWLSDAVLRIIFKALVQAESTCHIVAFNALTIDLLGTARLDLRQKYQIFQTIAKKLLCVVTNGATKGQLAAVNYAYGYNKLYVFLSDYLHRVGPINLSFNKKIAYFCGTFDPFNLGQKRVATSLAASGFDVYLAVDNFNWQRRTQPLELRRQIIEMTVADQMNVYAMPSLPALDLRVDEDCQRLKALFEGCQVHVVSGQERIAKQSCYGDADAAICKLPHLIVAREGDDLTDAGSCAPPLQSLKQFEWIKIDADLNAITNEKIRYAIDQQWAIDDLVDPLAERLIKKYRMYRNEPTYKSHIDAIALTSMARDQIDEALCGEVWQTFKIDLKGVLAGRQSGAQIIIIRDSETAAINGIASYRALSGSEFDDLKQLGLIAGAYRSLAPDNAMVIDLLAAIPAEPLHNHLLALHSELVVAALQRGYRFSLYQPIKGEVGLSIAHQLALVGYAKIKSSKYMLTTIAQPVVALLDAQSMLKRDYRQDAVIRSALSKSREVLLAAFTARYPNTVILTFERGMIYNKINQLVDALAADLMCVPYGDIYKRWLLPNRVTKALHSERVYNSALRRFDIAHSPHYAPINEQVAVIKSFRRQVLLIDDLVDKGLRLSALEGYFKALNVPIAAVVAGVVSERGKLQVEQKGYRILAGYQLPELRAWHSESQLYPFIGGESYYTSADQAEDVLPSVNKILPYMSDQLEAARAAATVQFSSVCLRQALSLLAVIERQYRHNKRRPLTVSRLNEVFVRPRVPYYGNNMQVDGRALPTDMIKNDFVKLQQIIDLIDC